MRATTLVLSIVILSGLAFARPAAAQNESGPLRDLLSLATMSTNYQQRDQMLLSGAPRFNEVSSFIAIAQAAAYEATKVSVLELGATRARSVGETIQLAAQSPKYDSRDRILLGGARLAQGLSDYLALAQAAAYEATKNALMQQGQVTAMRAADFIALASAATKYDVRDQILVNGSQRVHGLDEYIALVAAAAYEATKVTILRIGVREARNVTEVARMADLSPKYDARDEMLLGGVRLCTSAADAQFLVSHAAYEATKNSILRQYAQTAGFGTLYGNR